MSDMDQPNAPATDETPTAESGQSAPAVESVWVRSAALSGILLLLLLYTMYFAAALIMPIVLAFLLNLVLSPLVRALYRIHVPHTVGAFVVMLAVAGIMLAAIYAFAQPVSAWIEHAPAEMHKLERKLSWLEEPLSKVKKARQEVASMGSDSGDSQSGDQASGPSFSLVDFIAGQAPDIFFGVAVMLVLLFFLLSSEDALVSKMVQVTNSLENKRRVVETARDIQRHVSIYLVTLTGINLCVGVVVAIAMFLLGVPHPVLWGALLAILNFIPYLGVGMSIIAVTFVSLLTFDSLLHIAAPGLAILAINIVEGQFITPIVAGRRLALSPVAVFLSLVILGWIWGLVGVLIAVPVLASVKLVCERVEPLEPVATFLGRD